MLINFCRYNNDRRFVNPASDNTHDMPNDNDVQPTTQTSYLSKAALQYAGTLNKIVLFQY